jgi:hypothetical protein
LSGSALVDQLKTFAPELFGRSPESRHMQNLSPRHVKTEESLRLGVASGWYSTKVSGTFVSGPHDSEVDCLRKIAEIDPPEKGSARR